MNRVNGIYETDMAITMQLIANNDQIIYTNPNDQPYTHGNPDKLIIENQINVDAVIGSANYDIGMLLMPRAVDLHDLDSLYGRS